MDQQILSKTMLNFQQVFSEINYIYDAISYEKYNFYIRTAVLTSKTICILVFKVYTLKVKVYVYPSVKPNILYTKKKLGALITKYIRSVCVLTSKTYIYVSIVFFFSNHVVGSFRFLFVLCFTKCYQTSRQFLPLLHVRDTRILLFSGF